LSILWGFQRGKTATKLLHQFVANVAVVFLYVFFWRVKEKKRGVSSQTASYILNFWAEPVNPKPFGCYAGFTEPAQKFSFRLNGLRGNAPLFFGEVKNTNRKRIK